MPKWLIEYSLHCIELLSTEESSDVITQLIKDHVNEIRECVENLVSKKEVWQK